MCAQASRGTSQGKGDKFLCLYFLSCRLKCLSWDFTEGNHCTHSGTRNPQRFSPKIYFFSLGSGVNYGMLVKQGFNRISSIVAKYLKQLPHPSPSHTLSFPSPLSPLSLLPPTLPCSLSVVQMTMSLSTLPTTVLQASLPSLTRW